MFTILWILSAIFFVSLNYSNHHNEKMDNEREQAEDEIKAKRVKDLYQNVGDRLQIGTSES